MNLPNKITIARICMIPLFVIVLFSNLTYSKYIATLIFAIAAATDGIDGHIARKHNLITTFGKFMDPLADKMLVSTALISMVELGIVKAWVVSLIIAREFAITGFRTIAVSSGVTIAASSLGKIKTTTQMVSIILLLLGNPIFSRINIPMDQIMLYISLFFTLLSGIDYINKNKNVFNDN